MTIPASQKMPTLGELPLRGAFPERPAEFCHSLQLDERLTLAAIADLADRLPLRSVICDAAAQPLLVPQGGPPRGVQSRPGDVIRHLDEANAWLTLFNIEEDPDYAELMNSTLDGLERTTTGQQRTMRNRVGFIFVSSPNSVTPAHFDIEHSLLMQVSGAKTVSIGRFASERDRRHEVERYWDGSHGRLESLPPELASFDMTPGRGVYIPPIAPHWVHNGPAISLSMTLTYFTAASERTSLVEAFNARLRRMRLHPREPGQSKYVDTAKVAVMRGKAVGGRLAGLHHRDDAG